MISHEDAADAAGDCGRGPCDSQSGASGGGAAGLGDGAQAEEFVDALFRQKRKHGRLRAVPAPRLPRPVADTHTHVHLLRNPGLHLARCAVHGVSYLVDIVDICEEGLEAFDVMARAEASAPRWLDAIASSCEAGVEGGGVGARAKTAMSCDAAGGHLDAGRADGACADALPSLPAVSFAIGCHPHNASSYGAEAEDAIRRAVVGGRAAAVGEIGLDFHYDFSPRDVQREVFRAQLRLAHELHVPVSLHIREAHDEAFRILCEEGAPERGVVLHCFNLDRQAMAPWVEAGCYIAFGGPLTFKKADEVRDAAAHVPLDRLLLETDAPYMTPEPMRGMECSPEHVIFTAARLLEVRSAQTEGDRAFLLDAVMQNARRVFG